MRSWMIAFSVGITAAGFLPVLPASTLQVILLLVAILLHSMSCTRKAGAFCLGLWWLCHTSQVLLSRQWPREDRQVEVWVTGVVSGLPQATPTGQRFTLALQSRCTNEGAQPCVATTALQPGQLVQLNAYEASGFAPGQRWQLLVRLRPLHGFVNPGTFDYKLWQLQQGITATGYIRNDSGNRLLGMNQGERISRLRQRLAAALESISTLQHGGLLAALSLGIRDGIGDSDWQLFTSTGINHLMVISGLHIGLVAGFLFLLGTRLARTSCLVIGRWPATTFGALAALAGAFGYGALAGYALPVQRALIMTGVIMSGVLLCRQISGWNSYWLAMGLCLLHEPLAPQSAGFWLSFGAVALILSRLAGPAPAFATPAVLSGTCLLQGRLWVGMLPVMLVWFQQVSWLAPLVNLLAIPLVGMLVVPLALAGVALVELVPAAGNLLLQAADFCLHILLYALSRIMTLLPAALLTLPALGSAGKFLLLAAALSWMCCRNLRFRVLALIAMFAAMLLKRPGPAAGELEVVVMDVGQELAILVSTATHHLLYDTGPRYSENLDAGSDIVVPVLRNMNVRTLDRVIVSHADNDHAGGIAGIISAYPGSLYSLPDELASQPVPQEPCRAGNSWQWDQVQFSMLHPGKDGYNRNDSSYVLLITAGKRHILLPGDIGREVESKLLEDHELPQLSLLVAPHHGSRSSSSYAFIKQLRPEWVVFSSGYLNRFGHPASAIVDRYASLGSRVRLTSQSGALTMVLVPDSGETRMTSAQEQNSRFWQ
jgi:competence protein ComEC